MKKIVFILIFLFCGFIYSEGWVFKDNFSDEESLENWYIEKWAARDIDVEIEDDMLQITNENNKSANMDVKCVVKKEKIENFTLEVETKVLEIKREEVDAKGQGRFCGAIWVHFDCSELYTRWGEGILAGIGIDEYNTKIDAPFKWDVVLVKKDEKKKTALEIDPTKNWVKMKLVVKGDEILLYINDELQIKQKWERKSGYVGLRVYAYNLFMKCAFKNFNISVQ